MEDVIRFAHFNKHIIINGFILIWIAFLTLRCDCGCTLFAPAELCWPQIDFGMTPAVLLDHRGIRFAEYQG